MKPKTCQHPPCNLPVHTVGWCNAHYIRSRNNQDMDIPIKQQNKGRTCSQDECQKPAKSKGFCATHYLRFCKGLDMSAPIRQKLPNEICRHPPCGRSAQTAGWCDAHYQRSRDGRDMDIPIRPQYSGIRCNQEGCQSLATKLGMCNAHYLRARKGQPMNAPIREVTKRKSGPCPWPDCEREIKTGGLCQTHYRRKLKGRDMDAPIRSPRKSRAGLDRLDTKDGYILIRRPSCLGKEFERNQAWIYEHRYVMGKHLGRPLDDGENVHHINGNRADNRIENLELWISHQPSGQRVIDLLDWAYDLRERYKHDLPKLSELATPIMAGESKR